MKKNSLTLKLFLLVVSTDLLDSLSQFLMKKGVLETGIRVIDFSNVLEFISRSAGSFFVWLGLLVYVLSFFIWIVVLCEVDLSIALPIGSTSYILTPLSAKIFLHEIITPVRWLGILFVVTGICFVSQSNQDPLTITPCDHD